MIEQTKKSDYRPDVDGLRAIAIMCALVFHANPAALPGGYVGVDMFLVISGYLITRNIVRDVEAGKWSYTRFYIRRWRRLFPAYMFTIALTFLMAFLLFSPALFRQVCESILWSMVYVANIFFWTEAGYFDTESTLKPLLHLWSLGLEEQFYLLWPVTLVVAAPLVGKRHWASFFIVLGAISLLAAEYVMRIDITAAFYLLPFRIAEFALGGLLATSRWAEDGVPRGKEWVLLAGLGLIAYTAFTFDYTTHFPGLNAMITCLGTALAILGGRATYLGPLLSNRVTVTVGLLSYSTYLLHWPMLVFYRYWSPGPLSIVEQLLIIILPILGAGLMFLCIEQPLRFPRRGPKGGSNKPFFVGCGVAMVALALPALHGARNDGWTWRVPGYVEEEDMLQQMRKSRLAICHRDEISSFLSCTMGDEKEGPADMLVIGDSHSSALWPAFSAMGREYGLKIRGWSAPACYPVFGGIRTYHTARDRKLGEDCLDALAGWEDYIEREAPAVVVLASRWSMALESPVENTREENERVPIFFTDIDNPVLDRETSRQVFREKLTATVDRIRATGASVILVSQAPLLGIDPKACMNRPTYLYPGNRGFEGHCHGVDYDYNMRRLAFSNSVLKSIADEREGVSVLFLSDLFCDENTRSCQTSEGGHLLYADMDHISKRGARLVWQRGKETLKNALPGSLLKD